MTFVVLEKVVILQLVNNQEVGGIFFFFTHGATSFLTSYKPMLKR